MPDSSPALPHWAFQVLGLLASCGAGGVIVKFIIVWQNRHKPQAEVHETEARTTEITVRSNTVAGDAVIRMMDRLDEALDNMDRLREDRDEFKTRCDLQKIELDLRDKQIKKIMGFVEFKGLKISEMDEPKA